MIYVVYVFITKSCLMRYIVSGYRQMTTHGTKVGWVYGADKRNLHDVTLAGHDSTKSVLSWIFLWG